jgi:hypothetical protein
MGGGKGAKKLTKKQVDKKERNEQRRAAKRSGGKAQTSRLHAHLEAIASRDAGALARLLLPSTWAPHACGNSMLACESPAWARSAAEAQQAIFSQAARTSAEAQLGARGCTVVESRTEAAAADASNPHLNPLQPTFHWGADYERILRRVDATMDSLKSAGWPPVFVFLFDEPWLLIDRLYELVGPVLGEDCLLEASIYAWALSRCKPCCVDGVATAEADAAAEVGGNFAVPHRDNSFADCNFPDGTPSHLSLWMCVNDVGLDNGCMYVLPKDSDRRFHMTKDYWHERVAFPGAGQVNNAARPPTEQLVVNFPMHNALPMPAPRGSVLLWQPNCIHWGSSCSPSSFLEPRKSIAMSFRVSAEKRPIASYERDLLSREQVRALSLEDRLVIVAESMLMYAKWFPAFNGFDLSLLAVPDDELGGHESKTSVVAHDVVATPQSVGTVFASVENVDAE